MTKFLSIDFASSPKKHSDDLSFRRFSSHMFVGNERALRQLSQYIPTGLRIERCPFNSVSARMKEAPAPDIVVSFAISPQFDCVELAQLLYLQGFQGRQRIVGGDLPAPRMVCKEVRQMCPGLDFGILDPAELRQS